jgi:hypothetical protein
LNGLRSGGGPTKFDRNATNEGGATDQEAALVTEEELKRALKSFKKRLKLARLDDESGLSRGSKRSAIQGITPPTGHPPGIWEELVAKGKLRREMGGTYSLVEGA